MNLRILLLTSIVVIEATQAKDGKDAKDKKDGIIQPNGLTRRLLAARPSLRGRRVNKKHRSERQRGELVDEPEVEVLNSATVNSEALKNVVRKYKRVCSEVACWDEIVIS